MVNAFYEHFEYDDSSLEFQNAQPELQAYIQLLSNYTVHRSVKLSSERDWLDQAVTEHGNRPFHAIMTRDRDASDCLAIITPEMLDNIRNIQWYLPTLKPAKKSAEDIAAALEPILRMARYIVLVDPYFDASNDRYCTSLTALTRCACLGRAKGALLPKITVMTGIERNHSPQDGVFTSQQMQNVANDFRDKAIKKLPKCLPKGMCMDFYCLKHPESGDPLHNRFLLTDIGGVVLPYGLAAYKPDEENSAQDDLQPMLTGIYEARHRQYVEQKGIGIVLGPIRIEGAAD